MAKKVERGDKTVAIIVFSIFVAIFALFAVNDPVGAGYFLAFIAVMMIPSMILSPIVYGFLEADKNQCYRDNDN